MNTSNLGVIDPNGGNYPYVFVDGIFLKRCWGGEYENVSIRYSH